jgi:uncharacterized membrane protein YphA (DoxX/SURF4 family)
MKKLTIQYISKIFLVILGITPLAAWAHVKWFAEEVVYVRPYHITDVPVIMGGIAVVLMVCIGIYLEKKLPVPKKFHNIIALLAPRVLSVASIGFGLAFIIFSINGFIFAPNLPAHGGVGTLMLIIQGIAGVMILFGWYERFGGILLLVLFGLGIHQHGLLEMLDTLEMIGFALYAMIIGRPLWKIAETDMFELVTHHIHTYGYPLLRIGVGFNLIVLGFTEKILTPSLTQNFLTTHSWNFMSRFGMTDYWFSFAAGLSEILFGLFFVLGLVTRITTLALAVFLLTTLYLLGPMELIGHLPHFSIAVVLLVLGSGSRFVLVKNDE